MKLSKKTKISVIGLGYVGLPLLVEFSKKFDVVGFDINSKRVKNLKAGHDETLEVSPNKLLKIKDKIFDKENALKNQNFYIVTVPTPINRKKNPDLTALRNACKIIGKYIQKGSYIIFESTVYPGLTEEICIPILESTSGLKINVDFNVGYSPERINPGDKTRTLSSITKVVSASNPKALIIIDELYKKIIKAGTFKAQSIKVAEAAKVIENTQRDINIALMNELSNLFSKMEIDFSEVLKASNTKWNFLDFKPGLVGGHCIGVDPYYLTFKAKQIGFNPKMILAGRETNEMVPKVISDNLINHMQERGVKTSSARGLILGATFKENCPDFRNSKVDDLIICLKKSFKNIDLYDPYFSSKTHKNHSKREYFKSLHHVQQSKYDFIIIAVAHKEFLQLIDRFFTPSLHHETFIYDLKGILSSTDRNLTL